MPLRDWLNRLRYDSVRLVLWAAVACAALGIAWRYTENGRYTTQVLATGRLVVITDTRSGQSRLCTTLEGVSRCKIIGEDTLESLQVSSSAP